MKLLIVGGTSFAGRAIAWSAWHRGHDVSVFNRGQTPNDLPDAITRLVGDRDSDLSALADLSFDATIDVTAYRPSDVEHLADALGTRGGHYIQISSISAYRNPNHPGAVESELELDTSDEDSYGPMKAASERAGAHFFGAGATMIRPTFIVGAHDVTLRFPYWVERVRRGGDVVVPGPAEGRLQWIDARDLANFTLRVAEDGAIGAFHTAGPSSAQGFFQTIEEIAAQIAPPGTSVRLVDAERVSEAGLERQFPLWSPEVEYLAALDSSLAQRHGLDFRSLAESVDDVVEWWGDRVWPEKWLSAEDEARLLS
ncbi:MAG TPA: NAD-dependent epimerase/dehydratase family protein [Acidimicrobiales bacterium]